MLVEERELVGDRAGVWDPVDLLALEERNQRNFKNKDQTNHRELVSEQLVPRTTRLLQTSPAAERLLWLPDFVSSAFRRTITHRDVTRTLAGSWRARRESREAARRSQPSSSSS